MIYYGAVRSESAFLKGGRGVSDSSMTGMVQTVLGPVSPESLGPTMTHEHLLIDFTCMFAPPEGAGQRARAFEPITMENLGWINYDWTRHYEQPAADGRGDDHRGGPALP